MFIAIEANTNCEGAERMFSVSGPPRVVQKVMFERPGAPTPEWHDITGVGEGGSFSPAHAVQVEDSSDGAAWLVYGGEWGLRLKNTGQNWSLTDNGQWGSPFFLLDISGSSIQFG